MLEGGVGGAGGWGILALLHLLDLGVGLIGAIGLIGLMGLIGLEAWTDGLCAGYPSSRSVVFVPFRTILPVGKRRHVHSLSRGGGVGAYNIVGW